MKIQLLIADDHEWIREGLRCAFRDTEIEIAGEATTGDEAIQLALESVCDLLLLDIKMPGCNGFEVLQKVKSARPQMRVLLYSHHDRPDFRQRASQLAADGFLAKSADRNELIDAIRRVDRGERMGIESIAWAPAD